jgi:hypothetical protein
MRHFLFTASIFLFIERKQPGRSQQDEVERQIVLEAAAEGILEDTEENVQALKSSDVVLLRFAQPLDENQEKTFLETRHQFLKYHDVKTGPSDWNHTPFVILVCFLGLHKKWRAFKRLVGHELSNLSRLKPLHQTVENSVLDTIVSWADFKKLVCMQEGDIIARLQKEIKGFRSVPISHVPRRKLYATGSRVIPDGATIGHFISLDLKSANFNTLKLLLSPLQSSASWADFVLRCCSSQSTFSPEMINLAGKLKYLRAKTLGKVTPKRISFCQHLLMRYIFEELVPCIAWTSEDHSPFLFTCDEMIIPLASVQLSPEEAAASVKHAISIALPQKLIDIIRVELCSLERVEAPELMQRNRPTPSESQSSSQTPEPPKNRGRQDLMDGEFDGELEYDADQRDDEDDPPTSFYIRRGEDKKPQLKGLRYDLRWEALKLAKIFDPKVAFKAVTDAEGSQ